MPRLRSFGPSCLVLLSTMGYLAGCSQRHATSQPVQEAATGAARKSELQVLEVSEQARKNLKLFVQPARPVDYWRTITIPGVVADRPGLSDRGVTSPAVGVVSSVHVYPGDTIGPGQRLITLTIFSEYLQATQTRLFTASQELKLVQEQLDRLSAAANTGAVSGSRLIDLRNDFQRQKTLIQASRQELLQRGLSPEQINLVADGSFVSSIEVVAPSTLASDTLLKGTGERNPPTEESRLNSPIAYEVQSLGVDLGQTVQAGDLLVKLANHQSLYIVGHAFKREAGLLERAAQDKIPLRVEFAEDAAEAWPPLSQTFQIRHLSNTIDTASRTFDFYVPLLNQARSYQKEGMTFLAWRFRPGQRVRIEVPVEKLSNVFVLPVEGVVRDGPDAYVYRQNGDLFDQLAVHILHEDRQHVVVANDGRIPKGVYLAQNAAASLRRVLKAQSARGAQPGFHIHADGTVHAAH